MFLRSAPQARAGRRSGAEAPGPGLRRAERLYTALWAREKGGKTQRLSRALGGLAEALRGDRAPIRVHLLDTSRGVAETDPAVRTVTTQ